MSVAFLLCLFFFFFCEITRRFKIYLWVLEKKDPAGPLTKKNRVTSDSSQIWPTGKLIDLANHLPSSSPRGVLSFTQRFFQIG